MVKLDRASNTGLLRRCVVFLRLMLLVVEILFIVLRSMGTGHSVECSASTKCMMKCMGGEFWGTLAYLQSYFFGHSCGI